MQNPVVFFMVRLLNSSCVSIMAFGHLYDLTVANGIPTPEDRHQALKIDRYAHYSIKMIFISIRL